MDVDSNRSLEKRTNIDKILEIYFQRSLAKHEYKKNLDSSSIKERLPDYRIHMEIKNKKNMSPYGHLNKEGLNELDAYKKSYKDRYAKKKGFAKLDCYFEKNLFDKIDHVNGLAEKWQKDKNSFKKKILKKYGIHFLLFGLLPLLGLIFPVLFGSYKLGDGLLSWCGYKSEPHKHTGANSNCDLKYYDPELIKGIYKLNSAIFLIMSSIIIFWFIYIFIKVIKYERLKAEKGKMNRKEYFDFCKEVFKNK
ncbi:hypothetical protein PVIIG_06274 [Plasmodium vivax India VII]|uniref:Variable surface protein Vir35 n=1 Tax=Plasmodium vivax India VII TaxID=1077284 RepID=A0A0J9S3L8_PLAVI|nr:hypothetical protein PVIIG_06274 [Plasmodium vivax India VII]